MCAVCTIERRPTTTTTTTLAYSGTLSSVGRQTTFGAVFGRPTAEIRRATRRADGRQCVRRFYADFGGRWRIDYLRLSFVVISAVIPG